MALINPHRFLPPVSALLACIAEPNVLSSLSGHLVCSPSCLVCTSLESMHPKVNCTSNLNLAVAITCNSSCATCRPKARVFATPILLLRFKIHPFPLHDHPTSQMHYTRRRHSHTVLHCTHVSVVRTEGMRCCCRSVSTALFNTVINSQHTRECNHTLVVFNTPATVLVIMLYSRRLHCSPPPSSPDPYTSLTAFSTILDATLKKQRRRECCCRVPSYSFSSTAQRAESSTP